MVKRPFRDFNRQGTSSSLDAFARSLKVLEIPISRSIIIYHTHVQSNTSPANDEGRCARATMDIWCCITLFRRRAADT